MYEIPLNQLLNKKKISQRTYDKVIIAKQYIERKYNLKQIKNVEWNNIISKIDSLNVSDKEKKFIKKNIYNQEVVKYRNSRIKQTIYDYESIKIIGRGAFGEVHVCRNKKTDEIVAIKKIKKESLYNKNQIIHIKNEQLFMSKVKSPWIVELKASFQDYDYLYLVMEFLQGGDLMNILIKKDILTEEESRFYIAEIILAIESIHNLDCIHRDIKPDNVLIDKSGHIKLTDFGLAKISDKILYEKNNNIQENMNNINYTGKYCHNKNFSCVGTAYYVAPEVLNKKGYGPEIDWWSVGVIFFEMLVGYVPFCSKETNEACYKVLNWKKYLKIPENVRMSSEAEDLIFKLINSPKNRLGVNGSKEIKEHPFFYGFNWDNILNIKPPFIPFLKNEYDTSYFDTFEKEAPFYPPINKNNKYKRKNVEYLDYSFINDSINEISLYDEYQKALQVIEKKKRENLNSCDKSKKETKIIKKRSNGGNNFNLPKIFSSSQNEANNIPNLKICNSYKKNNNLKTVINNSLKRKLNKIINIKNKSISSSKNKINNCPSNEGNKNKVNVIKVGQKKLNKMSNKKESLNKIKIPIKINRSLKKNKQSKRLKSPICKNINNNKNITYQKISLNKVNNNLMNTINHYKTHCTNTNKINSKLNHNWSHLNIFVPINNKKRVFFSCKNEKNSNNNLRLNNVNINNYSINLLYNNCNKNKQGLLGQLDNSFNTTHNNKINYLTSKNKSFRLSPQIKNSEFFRKLFFRRNIPSSKRIIKEKDSKSPVIYLNSCKNTYSNGKNKIRNSKSNKTINKQNNSFNDKK